MEAEVKGIISGMNLDLPALKLELILYVPLLGLSPGLGTFAPDFGPPQIFQFHNSQIPKGWPQMLLHSLSLCLLSSLFLQNARAARLHLQGQREDLQISGKRLRIHGLFKDIVVSVGIATLLRVCDRLNWCQRRHHLDSRARTPCAELCPPRADVWSLQLGQKQACEQGAAAFWSGGGVHS